MALKDLRTLRQEAAQRDQPYITTIEDAIATLVNVAALAETELKVVYDPNPVITSLGDLEQDRIKKQIQAILLKKFYKVSIDIDGIFTIRWSFPSPLLNTIPPSNPNV